MLKNITIEKSFGSRNISTQLATKIIWNITVYNTLLKMFKPTTAA